jgi:hypothetical protein
MNESIDNLNNIILKQLVIYSININNGEIRIA